MESRARAREGRDDNSGMNTRDVRVRAERQIPAKRPLKAQTHNTTYTLISSLLMVSCRIFREARARPANVFRKLQVAFAEVTSHVGKKLPRS